MRVASALFILGRLLSAAGAQSREEASQAQAAPTPARAALAQMGPAERTNSSISVEFESSDGEAVALGHRVEKLWNSGQYDEALVQLGNLEARVGHVAIGNSWRKPVPTPATGLWGRDVRIGNRDSLLELSFDAHRSSGNLFVALRRGGPPQFSLCMSTDSGASWDETFTWSGNPPTSLDAAVLTNHLYVVYNLPEDDPQHLRLRRFLYSNGQADTFQSGGAWVVPCTLSVGDTMREVSLVSNPNNNRLHIVALVSDGSVLVSYADANAASWTRQPTGITSGARRGLDATTDQWSDNAHLFFSYYDTSDTMRVCDGNGQRLAKPAGTGALTSISAYLDTVVCVYEDQTSSRRRVRYAGSFDDGDTWTVGTLSDSDVAADAPAVTVNGGRGCAALYRSYASATELLFCQRTDSGPWSDPVSIAENGPSNSRPGIVRLGSDVYGIAYLSDTSPVVRGAYFDRSDRVYGITEQQRPQASSRASLATVVSGALFLPPSSLRLHPSSLLSIDGRKVLDLKPGANDVSRLAPGVYFVRAVRRGLSAVSCSKVVVTR